METRVQTEFQQLWEQTRSGLVRYMYCACRNWSDANDLAQECYLRALRNWARFDDKGSRQAWLFGIAHNTQVDWFRRQTRTRRVTAARTPGEGDATTAESNSDNLEVIWRAVSDLEGEQREVIHLRFAADLSYDQIADALGIPVGTVRSRLHRGLKTVRQQIEESNHGT